MRDFLTKLSASGTGCTVVEALVGCLYELHLHHDANDEVFGGTLVDLALNFKFSLIRSF